MSSVEHRNNNELKNYLELASLAGEKSLNEHHHHSTHHHQTKGTKLYKRANPLISQQHHNSSNNSSIQNPPPNSDLQQRMTANGFMHDQHHHHHQSRKHNNNSQLQALNFANAQMMPALQNHHHNHHLHSGVRNQNNRTTMAVKSSSSASQHQAVGNGGANHHNNRQSSNKGASSKQSHQILQSQQRRGERGTVGQASAGPYQQNQQQQLNNQELQHYTITTNQQNAASSQTSGAGNVSGVGISQQSVGAPTSSKQTGSTAQSSSHQGEKSSYYINNNAPKFLPQRQSPGAHSLHFSNKQNPSGDNSHQTVSNFTSSINTSQQQNQQQQLDSSSSNIYHGGHYFGSQQLSSKLPAKFISAKQASAIKSGQPTPVVVRARTNLDKYEDSSNQSYIQTTSGPQPRRGGQQIISNTSSSSHQQPVYQTIVGAPSSASVTNIVPSLESVYNGAGSMARVMALTSSISTSKNSQKGAQQNNQENSSLQSLVQTPQTGTISARKLSSQFINGKVNANSNQKGIAAVDGPYNHNHNSANTTIEPITASLPPYQISISGGNSTTNAVTAESATLNKKSKFQLHPSKMVLEPINTKASMSGQVTGTNKDFIDCSSTLVVANASSTSQPDSRMRVQQAITASNSEDRQQQSSYVMLPVAKGSSSFVASTNSQQNHPHQQQKSASGLNAQTGRTVSSNLATTEQQQSEQQRRASHQPLSILQNRISSQMAYRCYSRQKENNNKSAAVVQSRGGAFNSRGSRQRTGGLTAASGGVPGEGDLGPLPRAIKIQQQQSLPPASRGGENSSTIGIDRNEDSQSPSRMIMLNRSSDVHNQQLHEDGRPQMNPVAYSKDLRTSGGQMEVSAENPFETERQLIIARGGSLTRKVNQAIDDDEDIFNDRGGFRIKINKEQKVVNHLEDRVENNNLLFYNFNAYKQHEPQCLDNSSASVNNNYGTAMQADHPSKIEVISTVQQMQRRPYSRTSAHSQSRQDYRQRHIQSAASVQQQSVVLVQNSNPEVGRSDEHDKATALYQSRQQNTESNNSSQQLVDQSQQSNLQSLLKQSSNQHIDSCTSLQTTQQNQKEMENEQIDEKSQLPKEVQGEIQYINSSNQRHSTKVGISNRYRQQDKGVVVNGSINDIENRYRSCAAQQNILNLDGSNNSIHGGQNHSHSANRHEINLAVNVTSSGSLTTAATTKGSDFGTSKQHTQHQTQISCSRNGASTVWGGGTPHRNSCGGSGSMSIMQEVFVPPRPTNTSRILHDQHQMHNGSHQAAQQSIRKYRGGMQHRGSESLQHSQTSSFENEENSTAVQHNQYQIIKASQTSMGSNSFARSAMRLKQKSSRNGLPNRGGSLDGCSQSVASNQSPSGARPQNSHGGGIIDSNLNQVVKQSAAVQQVVKSSGIMSRAGRTAGGAMWSRMLNMQSVEEGIQEGNVSSEDD